MLKMMVHAGRLLISVRPGEATDPHIGEPYATEIRDAHNAILAELNTWKHRAKLAEQRERVLTDENERLHEALEHRSETND